MPDQTIPSSEPRIEGLVAIPAPGFMVPAITALFPTIAGPVLSGPMANVTAAHPDVLVAGVVVVTRCPVITRTEPRIDFHPRDRRCNVDIHISSRAGECGCGNRGDARHGAEKYGSSQHFAISL